ncbi:ribonuclease T2-like [Actinomortierella ambigua]|nr:ribonuclease T2-like [Actinomortierella ambigua]
MHGFWPNTCTGDIVNNCDPSRRLSDVEHRLNNYPGGQQLLRDMRTYWPSKNGDNNWFWSHEWSKHGTCLSNIAPSCTPGMPPHYDLFTYFNTTLALRAQYNLYQALAAGGILPGSNPHSKDIQRAIQSQFKVQAEINCALYGATLDEIWLYFNVKDGLREFVPVNSPDTGSCRGYIQYPKKSNPAT